MEFDGYTLAVMLVVCVICAVAWMWISWVAIGILMVYWLLPADFYLHVFLWICANTIIAGFSVKMK